MYLRRCFGFGRMMAEALALVNRLPKRVGGIEVENDLDLRRDVVGEVHQRATARDGHQHAGSTLLESEFHDVDRVVHRLDRTAEINPTDNGESALERLAEQGGSK